MAWRTSTQLPAIGAYICLRSYVDLPGVIQRLQPRPLCVSNPSHACWCLPNGIFLSVAHEPIAGDRQGHGKQHKNSTPTTPYGWQQCTGNSGNGIDKMASME